MITDTKIFLKYLRVSIETLGDYFLDDSWLIYKENAKILSQFILSVAHVYPDVDARHLYEAPTMPTAIPRPVWQANSDTIASIVSRIYSRQKPGLNDSALCGEMRSAIHALLDWVPEIWPGHVPAVPDEVIRIIDNNSRYESRQKYQ